MGSLRKIFIFKRSKGSTICTSKSDVNSEPSDVEDVTISTFLDPDSEYSCEYKDEIWNHLLQEDARRPTFYMQSPQLELRGTLVQQLRDLTTKLELSLATLHSAVAYLDLFMDSHHMISDGLSYIALACLSLAAKIGEKYSQAPSLKKLSRISNVQLDGKLFHQAEWVIGEHLEWRLLAPTAVHFAALLSQYVVTDKDLTTRNPRLLLRLKRDASKFLDEYLDLSLSDYYSSITLPSLLRLVSEFWVSTYRVTFSFCTRLENKAKLASNRLSIVETLTSVKQAYDVHLRTADAVDVGCACIACARNELGFLAWPHWLVKKVNRPSESIAMLVVLLDNMMRIKRNAENKSVEPEVINGGSVSSTPTMSTELINVDSSLPSGTRNDNMPGVKPKEVKICLFKILKPYKYNKLLSQPDTNIQRVNLTEHAYYKNDRTIENTLKITEEPKPKMLTKKRHLLRDIDDEVETKRCLASYLMNFKP